MGQSVYNVSISTAKRIKQSTSPNDIQVNAYWLRACALSQKDPYSNFYLLMIDIKIVLHLFRFRNYHTTLIF